MRDRSDLDWQETLGRVCDSLHNFDLVTTSINNALRRPQRKKMFNQGITSMRGFRNYQTTFGVTLQTSCTKKLLVQATATANQRGCTLGFLTNTTLVRFRILFPTYQLPTVGSPMLEDNGDLGPDSTPDLPWTS
jgi:hypothetical protein